MSRESLGLPTDLHSYLLSVSVRETEALQSLREETARHPYANMQIAAEQGAFMSMLVRITGAKRILEVGTFTGYSTLCVASGLSGDGRLITLDIDEEWPSLGRRYWAEAGVGHKIEFRGGPASKTLSTLIADGMEGDFDFVFIDADKRGLDDYYEKSLRLVRSGGLIAVDNTLWGGKVMDPLVSDDETISIRGFNAKVYDDRRVSVSLVPIGDGLTLLRKG